MTDWELALAREKALRTNTGNPGYYRNQMSERLLNLTADRLSSTIKEDIRATLEQGRCCLVTPLT